MGIMGVQLRIEYSDRLTVLDFGPQSGGPACLGAHVFYLSAFHILQAVGTALVLDAVARRIHKIE